MATKRNSRRTRRNGPDRLGKPRGVIQPRVQAVGPERFGVAAVDCAKARSKWLLCDFYGKVLLPPTEVEHARMQMQLATVQFHEACERHGIRDAIVAVEMTGTYHRPIQRAFRKSGAETRLVHPFASSHYRATEHADNKTDDHDLEAIFRAAVNGFGLLEPAWDETYLLLQLFSRHRRDLVEKRAKLQYQIRQYLERCMPGYAELFGGDDLWKWPTALAVARNATTADTIRRAGIPGVTGWLRAAEVRFMGRTVEKIVAWAGNAAVAGRLRTCPPQPPPGAAATRHAPGGRACPVRRDWIRIKSRGSGAHRERVRTEHPITSSSPWAVPCEAVERSSSMCQARRKDWRSVGAERRMWQRGAP